MTPRQLKSVLILTMFLIFVLSHYQGQCLISYAQRSMVLQSLLIEMFRKTNLY